MTPELRQECIKVIEMLLREIDGLVGTGEEQSGNGAERRAAKLLAELKR